MRNRSADWVRLAARGNFRLETVAVINGVEYSTITAPVITNGLLPDKTLSVGNCIAGTIQFTVMTNDTIPKSAEIVIKSRITDETTYSEWLEFGHFWIDTRSVNSDLDTKLIDIKGFDAMLKGNQPYVDNSQGMNWPKTMQTVVNRIAEQMGVQVDSRTVIKTGNDYIIYKPGDDMTLLDILSYIGTVHGGNWTITPEGKLRLVPLVSAPPETFYIVDENYWRITTPEGDNLVSQHGESYIQPNGIGYINVPVVLGDINTAKTYQVSGVVLTVDEETSYSAGDDTGYVLQAQVPYATQALCDALLADVDGLVYSPYTMTKAVFDPAVELGDVLFAGDRVHSVLYIATQRFDLMYTVDTAAPGEDELESEYPYVSAIQKSKYVVRDIQALRAENAVMWSSITQNAENIELKVGKDSVISAINLSSEAVTISANKVNLSGYATFTSLSTSGETTINGDNITTGTLSANRIAANSIAVSKLTGTITNGNWQINLTNGTLSIGDISANNITAGKIQSSVNSYSYWNLDTGEIRIEGPNDPYHSLWINPQTGKTELNATIITAGYISADRIEAGSITTSKLNAGAVTADKIAAGAISADMITAGTMAADRISGGTLELNGVNVKVGVNIGQDDTITVVSDVTPDAMGGYAISYISLEFLNGIFVGKH